MFNWSLLGFGQAVMYAAEGVNTNASKAYMEAKKYLGLEEVKDRTKLMDLFQRGGLTLNPATTPWCAAFVTTIEILVGHPSTRAVNARSYLKYGDKVLLANARQGDILVFSRGGSNWQGHVGYFTGEETDDLIQVLGGNQGDMVKVSWYPKSRLLGIRRYV